MEEMKLKQQVSMVEDSPLESTMGRQQLAVLELTVRLEVILLELKQ